MSDKQPLNSIKEILWLVSIGAMTINDAENKICSHLIPLIDTICDQDEEIEELEAKMKGGD